jgi:colanic acid biosynthesis glycosyl transferase WcaI
MRFLFVTTQYAPDGGPAAPLFQMLCEALQKRGHSITVIAAVPHYPSGQVPPAFRKGWLTHSLENGVRVVRVRVPSLNRDRLTRRLLLFALYQLGGAIAALTERCDAVLVANPALETGLPFFVLRTLRRKPTIFSVHDVYPEVGVQLGIFRHKPVISLIAWSEKFCFRRSAYVRILSESFADSLQAMGVPEPKTRLIYDWVDTDLIRPLPRQNAFAAEHNLNDKFVVMYAGNIGLSQGLEHVLSAAQQLAGQTDIQFVLVGDGAAREALLQQAQTMQLSNVLFLPFQPRPRLPEVLASADISLISLQPNIGTGSLPSKSFSILASGRPALAIVDQHTATAALISRAQAGLCTPPADVPALVAAILQLKNDSARRQAMGGRGRAYAEQHHSPHGAALQFEALFQEIAQ